jgi:enediyne biosynthesis protein CalE5
MTTVEPTEFRSGQRNQWNTAASGWKKWAPLIDKGTAVVSERLVELAGIKDGDRVLDVACGYGEPALTAARRVGADGEVVATDISPEMLAYGQERAAAAGLEHVQFIESEAAALDFDEGSFDAALSRWGIIFEPEAEGTAARIRGFLKPGAKMAISSWGPIDRAPMFGLTMGVVVKHLGLSPPPPGTPGPLSRPTREALAGLLEGGGFLDVRVEEVDVLFELGSPEEFTTYMREIAPPISALMRDFPADAQQGAWDAITDAARERAGGDKPFALSNLALLAAGTA